MPPGRKNRLQWRQDQMRRDRLKQVEDLRPGPGMTGIVRAVAVAGVADVAAVDRKGLRLSRKSLNLCARL